MASVVPDFEYDIFISYRHNDNRSGWVTEFVKSLQEELAATIKEPISVYFDLNPQDGILETHSVDKSLEGKLKCLIFIPILSQTYCDTKSFAWQHEFCSFNKLAKEDQFGSAIKLTNGNFTSRILPIKIHDLDAEDKLLLENELGGALRAIEFIYKEPGVNRPLKSTDSKTDNQSKADYRNQVNKLANAIKDIINGIKKPSKTTDLHRHNEQVITKTHTKTKILFPVIIVLVLLGILSYILYPKLSANASVENQEKSIAVLTFKNIGQDQRDEYFSDGMTEEVISYLAKVGGLKVISRTSIEQYKGQNKDIRTIAAELGVSHILEGSVRKAGNKFRISVQLIEASTGFNLWSHEYDKEITDVLQVQSDISREVTDALKIVLTENEKQNIEKTGAVELTAYDFYLKARSELVNFRIAGVVKGQEHAQNAIVLFKKSLKADPDFTKAYSGTGIAMLYVGSAVGGGVYIDKSAVDSARVFADAALRIDNKNDEAYYLRGVYYNESGNFKEAILNFRKAIDINPNNVDALVSLGAIDDDYVKGLAQLQRAVQLDRGPDLAVNLRKVAGAYSAIGLFAKSEEYYKIAARLDNDSTSLLGMKANMERANHDYESALVIINVAYQHDPTNWFNADEKAWILSLMGRYQEALDIRLEWKKLLKGEQATMTNRIGYLYAMLGDQQRASEYFTRAINNAEESVRSNSPYAQSKFAHYDLAGIFAFRGETEKAYQYLDEMNKRKFFPFWFIAMMQDDPLFESIRNEDRFKKIHQQMKARSMAERDRVVKWLESEGMKTKIAIQR